MTCDTNQQQHVLYFTKYFNISGQPEYLQQHQRPNRSEGADPPPPRPAQTAPPGQSWNKN